jgi:hypothetical protein
MEFFWDENNSLIIDTENNSLQNCLYNFEVAELNLEQLNKDTTQQNEENIQQNDSNSDNSLSDENDELSMIDKIKKDLRHEVNENSKFESPFQADNDYKVFKKIVDKIERLGKTKGINKQRLEIAYYLGKLRADNENNSKFLRKIRNKLTTKFGKQKSAKVWKYGLRIYQIYNKFGLVQLYKAKYISTQLIEKLKQAQFDQIIA